MVLETEQHTSIQRVPQTSCPCDESETLFECQWLSCYNANLALFNQGELSPEEFYRVINSRLFDGCQRQEDRAEKLQQHGLLYVSPLEIPHSASCGKCLPDIKHCQWLQHLISMLQEPDTLFRRQAIEFDLTNCSGYRECPYYERYQPVLQRLSATPIIEEIRR